MAVTTTGQDIFDAALAKSSKSEPTKFSTAEIVNRINRRLSGIYNVAARVNPSFLADTLSTVEAGGTWPRPEEAISVVRVEQDSNSAEVVVVPYDDRQAEPSRLSLYEFAQVFTAITTSAGTPTGNLTFWFPKRPVLIANLSPAVLDLAWREDFNEFLVLELAIDFAIKDGRLNQEGQLLQDRLEWLQLWVAFLQHTTAIERRRFGNRRPININSLLPLLAGGQ